MAGHIKKAVLTTTLLVTILVGCNSSVTQQSTLPSIPPTKATLPTRVYTTTPDIHPQTPIITVQSSSTVPPISIGNPITTSNPQLKSQCLDALDESTGKGLGKGVTVLKTLGIGYSLLNMDTGEKINLDTDQNLTSADSSVSPNGKLLALEKFESGKNYKHYIFIVDSSGQIKQTLDGDYLQSNNPAWTWLNNQQLIFNISFLYPDLPGYNYPEKFLVLNPSTGEQQFLTAKFPKISDSGTQPTSWDYPWNWSRVAYNSKLTHAVYLGERVIKYSLWDFSKGKSVADILSLQGHSGPPRWSPDGSRLLMYGFLGETTNIPNEFNYHLYIIHTNGYMESLDENQIWEFDENTWQPSYDGYFWSPSGRYIALFMYQENYKDRLVVLDTQTMMFTDYCITFGPVGSYITIPPIWSPDESQLIIEDQVSQPNEGFRSRLILADFIKGIAVQIAENTQAKGWMTSNP